MGYKDVEGLMDLNSGAIEEQFGREWRKVIGNIGDPSTEAKKIIHDKLKSLGVLIPIYC